LNLKLITEPEFTPMKEADQQGTSQRLAELLALPQVEGADHAAEFSRRFLGLALEALRRELISRSKFVELAQQVGASKADAGELIESAGFDNTASQSVLIPGN
jgi:hypothetical protein